MEPAQKANDVLAALPLPAWIVRHEVREVVDHTDQPALRITLYVQTADDPNLDDGAALGALGLRIHHAMQAHGITLWPYVEYAAEDEEAYEAAEVLRASA
jgi:hypothetical protein